MTNQNPKNINWNGDFSNAPRSGVVTFDGDLARITWDDGRTNIAPIVTLKSEYGWTISDIVGAGK